MMCGHERMLIIKHETQQEQITLPSGIKTWRFRWTLARECVDCGHVDEHFGGWKYYHPTELNPEGYPYSWAIPMVWTADEVDKETLLRSQHTGDEQ